MSNVNVARIEGAEFYQGSGRPLDLSGMADVFVRRWKLLAAVIASAFIVAVIADLVIRPVYQASATIRIDPTERSAVEDEAAAARGAPPDQALVDTEVKIMQSREVARSVAESMNLTADPEFNPRLHGGFHLFAGKSGTPALDLVVDSLQKHLSVMREGPTYIVAMQFSSLNPGKAANLANAFTHAYLEASIESKVRSATEQSAWYAQRMQSVSEAAKTADAELERFKAANDIVDSSGGDTVTQQQIATVTEQLASAEAAAAAARSNVQAAKSQISQGGLDSVSSVLNSPTILELRHQRADLLRNRDEIETRYGPKHPETLKITQQVQGLEQQIRDESQRIISGLESDARASDAKVASLRGALNSLKGELANNSRASVQADNLKREADAKNAMLSKLAASAQQSEQAQHVSLSQATIVAPATTPTKPAFPNLALFASLGLALGVIGGIGAVAGAETLDSTLRTAESVEQFLGAPFIAYLPLLTDNVLNQEGRNLLPWDYVRAKPMSAFAEAMRTARSAIKLSNLDNASKIIAMTSAFPNEGKTVCSVSLARIIAMSGERALLIDCDLRRNALEGLMTSPPTVGLVEVLAGSATLASAIVPDTVPGLDILPLHKASFTPRDLFGAHAMRELLGKVRVDYDYIILDGPPVLAVNDARTLASLADVVLVMAKWGSTPKSAVRAALDHLEQDKSPIAGVILTMVDTSSSLAGGYAGYYSSRYTRYYQN